MVKQCLTPYLLLALAVIVVLFIGIGLWEQMRLRRAQTNRFDHQGARFLLTMLGVGLISIVIFAVYIAAPQAGCF